MHAIPGLLGGIISAIAVAVYASDPLTNATQISYLPFYPQSNSDVNSYGRTFYEQGGIQIAGTFISMGIGIGFGLVAGLLMKLFYVFDPEEFYQDNIFFDGLMDDI